MWDRRRRYGCKTDLAEPNGLDLVVGAVALGVGPIFGEPRGLEVPDALPLRGSSSSFRRIWGVGGVELVAVNTISKPEKKVQKRQSAYEKCSSLVPSCCANLIPQALAPCPYP